MGNPQPIILKQEDAILTVMINNPDKMNALTGDCIGKITETFRAIKNRPEIRAVIIRGAGDLAFSAGADITALPDRKYPAGKEGDLSMEQAIEAIRQYPFPVIAMLNGVTIGAGFILAMACDIRIGAGHIKMGLPTSKMGLIPGYRWLRHYIAALGLGRTNEIVLTGRLYDGAQCLEMGMVSHVVDQKDLEAYTYELAGDIAKNAPLSLEGAKFIMNRLIDNPVPEKDDIEAFHEWEKKAVASDDHAEAKLAFKEKRRPVFKGR
jgi:enoyl-CoA hydratase